MNFIYRIGIGSIACIAVACSKDATETAAPVAEPETVIIGCSGATGADVDVRTQLENDGLSVRWSQGDEIRLWAREHKEPADASPTYVVENLPFRFYYYSPSWSRAGFKGTISGVESKFERAKKYDYFAVSPAPASDADVDAPADGSHINVTYTIPAEQTGEFDGRYDIMTAKPLTAQGLQAGDDNPSVNLVFHHHIHLLKFTIASSKWEANRPIRAVRLTFPCPVVGRLTVDATDSTVNKLTALADDKGEGKELLIKFSEEKNVGDTFYAMIAPVSFESGETETESGETGSSKTIKMQIIGTLGETSVDLPIADKDDNTDKKVNPTLAAGRSTLINLNVKAMNPYKTVTLKFNVVDNDRSEFAGVGNELGVNTLGERVHTVRVIGAEGAFSNALWKSEGCSVRDSVCTDGTKLSVLTCTVPPTGGDGIYSLTFLSKKLNPDYLWPDEELLWNDDDKSDKSILGKKLKVEYESTNAWIRTIDGYSTVQTSIPSIPEEQKDSYEGEIKLSIPYLFEEDFSGLSEDFEQETRNKELNEIGLNGWIAGHRSKGYRGLCLSLRSYSNMGGPYQSRINGCPLSAVKQGCTVTLNLEFYADWKKNSAEKMLLKVGRTVGTELGDEIKSIESPITMQNNSNASQNYIPTLRRVTVEDYTCDQWIAWETVGSNKDWFNYEDLFIDNIKISIAH